MPRSSVSVALVVLLSAFLTISADVAILSVDPTSMHFTAMEGDSDSRPQELTVTYIGTGTSGWDASTDATWLSVSPDYGTSSAVLSVWVDTSEMVSGTTEASTITISAPDATVPVVNIPVTVTIFPSTCRGVFFTGDFVRADELCEVEPSDEAAFLRSITRLLRIVEDQADGPDPSAFTDSLKELLEQFGVPSGERSVFDFDVEFPEPLPSDSPTGGEVQEFLRTVVVEELTGAIEENLRSISDGFSMALTLDELAAFGLPETPGLEIDAGDMRVYEAALGSLKGAVLSSLLAYDLDLDIAALSTLAPGIQQSIIEAKPNLLNLSLDGPAILAEAKIAFDESIDAYYAGSNFIRKLDDPDQSDDFITIAAADLAGELEFRTTLGKIQCSLDGFALLEVTDVEAICGGSPVVGEDPLDLSRFFDDPFDLREMLPPFLHDSECGDFIDTAEPSADYPFPDPTFNGTFPGMTQEGLIESLGLVPGIEVYVYFETLNAPPGGTSSDSVYVYSGDALWSPALEISNVLFAPGSVFGVADLPEISPNDPIVLCQEEALAFTVTFSPVVEGVFTDTLYIESNDPETPVFAISIVGCTSYSGDCDGDGFPDHDDNCPYVYNPDQSDTDGDDGDDVGNVCDNCVDIENTPQIDTDGDCIDCSFPDCQWCGDACDSDDDNDGFADPDDCAPRDDTVYPGAPELNDGLDNQCSGDLGYELVDETSENSVFNDSTTYSWDPQPGATLYQVARSSRRDFAQDCRVFTTAETPWSDSDEPVLGRTFYYLSRALAPNPGSWGRSSSGSERKLMCAAAAAAGDLQADSPLLIGKAPGGQIRIMWGPSCLLSDDDYEVYAGFLRDFGAHVPVTCTTDGALEILLTPNLVDSYFLVVPRSGSREGSYGTDSSGALRPQGYEACFEQSVGSCP